MAAWIDVVKSLRPRRAVRRAVVYALAALATLGLAAEVVLAIRLLLVRP